MGSPRAASFARYAALVKNLRGVVLADLEDEGVRRSVRWLVERFRYRNLGLTPSAARRFGSRLSKHLGGRPFVELAPPVGSTERLAELLSAGAGLAVEVAELLVYASTYISPGIVVGEAYAEAVSRVSADSVLTCREMKVGDWKLHLRVADYTVLDIYAGCVEEVLEALSQPAERRAGALRGVAERRRARVAEDKRRYWRISCEAGRTFLLYVDMVDLVLKHGLEGALEPDHAAGLAVVPVVVVPPGLG